MAVNGSAKIGGPAGNPLESPQSEAFTRDTLHRTASLAGMFLDLEQREPVAPTVAPDDLAEQLDLGLGEAGLPLDRVFELLGQVMEMTPRTSGRFFFNQLFAGRDAVPTAAEMLTALMNSSMYTYRIAGPHALIEDEVVRHMSGKVGYAEGEGIFCPGGSMSNLAAMIVARNQACPGAQQDGFDGRSMTAYASADAHYSFDKAAGMIGIGRANVRKIPTDARGAMMPEALRQAIRNDLEHGAQPFMIIATAGTTVLGAFDPIDALASIAEEFGLWLHVDGALGGSFLLSQKHRPLLRGSERSDSFNWNPHKLMGVPLSCSALLVQRRGLLRRHFNERADYLFQADEDRFDFGTMSMQCGRRNDAFKIWAGWKRHGDAGYARRVDRLIELAQYAAQCIRSDPQFVLTAEPESVTVCFEVRDRASDAICDRLLHDQRSMVGHAVVGGRRIIRIACASPEVTERDLDRFFEHVRAVAAELVPLTTSERKSGSAC